MGVVELVCVCVSGDCGVSEGVCGTSSIVKTALSQSREQPDFLN